MDLADHLRVIASNWWRILLVAVVVAAATFGWSQRQEEIYEAGILLNIASTDVVDPNRLISEDQLDFRASFFTELAKTETIAEAAVAEHDLGMTAKEARSLYDVGTTETSGFLYITSNGDSPENARKLASGVARALMAKVERDQESNRTALLLTIQQRITTLEAELEKVEPGSRQWSVYDQALANNNAALIEAQTKEFFRINAVAPATPKRTPVSPTPGRDATLGFLVAFVLAAEATVVARAFGDRFARTNDAAAITALTGLPVLSMIPRGRGPEVVEAFRTLRTNLMFLEGAGRPRTIAIVSPNPASGKSFVSLHLAESAVAVDASVVLIDADLRRPVLHTRLRVAREPGLSNALRGTELEDTLHPVANMPNFSVMPSGSPVNDTVGVLGGRAFRQILDSLDTAELVIVDTPPATVYADALAVSAQCDAALLVLDARSTRRRAARQLIESLERTGATLIGAVVNSATVNRRDTYGYDRG